MRWALRDAGIEPDEINYINAHGTSTPINDAVETLAIKKLFGEQAYNIPISSSKSMIGHCLGASGAVESLACIKAIETGIVPPTVNYDTPDPECDLDYVPETGRKAQIEHAVCNCIAFGSKNSALVLRRTT